MREFELTLTKALLRGLRPFPEIAEEPTFLEECFNLMPSELGLRGHEPINGIPLPTSTWPFSRLVATQWRVFAFVIQGPEVFAFTLSRGSTGGWSAVVLGNIGDVSLVDQVDVADFGHYAIISTSGFGGTVTQSFEISTLGILQAFSGPTFGTVCNFRQQCVGANVPTRGGPAFDSGTNYIQWSGIGNATFDPVEDRTAGFKQQLFPTVAGQPTPIIYRVLPLKSGIVVYSNAGKVLLTPAVVESSFTYGQTALPGLGIRSGNHVAGDADVHGFVDLNGDFWILESNAATEPKKRGYRTYIQSLLQDGVVVISYIPRDQRFYISNGHSCLVINSFGACFVHQVPSSVIVGSDGLLFGTLATVSSNDTEARITTDPSDFRSRGLKTLESIMSDLTTSGQSFFSTEYTMGSSPTFNTVPWVPGGPRAEAVVRTTAESFKIKVKLSTYVGALVRTLSANVKFPDRRFRRGLTGMAALEQP